MADVQCEKFYPIWSNPETGEVTFRARVSAAPSPLWREVFHECQATERALGNPAVARIGGNGTEFWIEFNVPEPLAQAAAQVIRRCLDKANQEAPKREARREETIKARERWVEEERKRLQDKFRDGL
jgi:hypothetical protein